MSQKFKVRPITKLIIHCSATPEGRNVTVDDIRKWHVDGNGWRDIGYHYVIHLDGSVHEGRPEWQVGAHVVGHNANSIGICYIGGVDEKMQPKDTRTDAQKEAMGKLLLKLSGFYPRATIHGHNEFANKACPSFDAKAEYADLTRFMGDV